MFRRIRRAAFQASTINPVQMQSLTNANQLVASGHPGQAAPLFANLAQEMEIAAHPRRAANLHAQAAHAYADSQNEQAALDQARRALNLFIQCKMINRFPVFYTNITRKLTNKGMKSASETLMSEFGSKIGPMSANQTPSLPHQGQLPTNCSKCGAPIHKNDANWVDDQTIECDFCGSLIRSE
ncbi:MAG: hypothetical protein ABSG01_02980 [Anaerolineales bacterium]